MLAMIRGWLMKVFAFFLFGKSGLWEILQIDKRARCEDLLFSIFWLLLRVSSRVTFFNIIPRYCQSNEIYCFRNRQIKLLSVTVRKSHPLILQRHKNLFQYFTSAWQSQRRSRCEIKKYEAIFWKAEKDENMKC